MGVYLSRLERVPDKDEARGSSPRNPTLSPLTSQNTLLVGLQARFRAEHHGTGARPSRHLASVAHLPAARSGGTALLSCRTPAARGTPSRRRHAEVVELEDPSL